MIDDDKVCLTNLNRQIIATRKTVGKYKADVMKERMQEINPDCFDLVEWVLFDTQTESVYESEVDKIY